MNTTILGDATQEVNPLKPDKEEVMVSTYYYVPLGVNLKKISNSRPVFVADADGVLITAVGVGSEFSVLITCEDPVLVQRVKNAASFRQTVDYVWGVEITAGWNTPEGIIAALLLATPGRTRILQAPPEALNRLDKHVGSVDPDAIY